MKDDTLPKTLTLLAPSVVSTDGSYHLDREKMRPVGRAANLDLSQLTGFLDDTFSRTCAYLQNVGDEALSELLEEFDQSVMARVQERLRANDKLLARQIQHVIRNTVSARTYSADERAFALETIVAARSAHFDDSCADLVRESMGSPEADLRFAAVAAFGDLPPAHRDQLRGVIQRLQASDESEDVRRAAGAAIQWADKRRA